MSLNIDAIEGLNATPTSNEETALFLVHSPVRPKGTPVSEYKTLREDSFGYARLHERLIALEIAKQMIEAANNPRDTRFHIGELASLQVTLQTMQQEVDAFVPNAYDTLRIEIDPNQALVKEVA